MKSLYINQPAEWSERGILNTAQLFVFQRFLHIPGRLKQPTANMDPPPQKFEVVHPAEKNVWKEREGVKAHAKTDTDRYTYV